MNYEGPATLISLCLAILLISVILRIAYLFHLKKGESISNPKEAISFYDNGYYKEEAILEAYSPKKEAISEAYSPKKEAISKSYSPENPIPPHFWEHGHDLTKFTRTEHDRSVKERMVLIEQDLVKDLMKTEEGTSDALSMKPMVWKRQNEWQDVGFEEWYEAQISKDPEMGGMKMKPRLHRMFARCEYAHMKF